TDGLQLVFDGCVARQFHRITAVPQIEGHHPQRGVAVGTSRIARRARFTKRADNKYPDDYFKSIHILCCYYTFFCLDIRSSYPITPSKTTDTNGCLKISFRYAVRDDINV